MSGVTDPASDAPPLGAAWDGTATTFRVFSAHATAVELELGDGGQRIALARGAADIWSARVPVGPGARYGYRAHGPWSPSEGHLFNPSKLLLDPHARAIDGPIRWHESLRTITGFGPVPAADGSDSAAHLPRCVVMDMAFDWRGDTRPRTPWSDTVIYECHVRGMTALHPDVPPALRGTWLGLASDPILSHLASLGITAIELMPVHPATDSALVARNGLTNYWGYASINFFAPDRRYARVPGRETHEFREMVRRFHSAGMEVLLDVVYNHSGEGDRRGPTVSFRGLDNVSYYRLRRDQPGAYEDLTGCGNTLDIRVPPVRRMVRDSLRFWVDEMHVDGFRFDLAPALGRHPDGFTAQAPLFQEIASDPVLQSVKLIAEPWDLGPEGYRQGAFPAPFAEWNGRYRDTVRRFWRGVGGVSELATRVSGSSDLFAPARAPQASINFVACHDGFTLLDLVSYARKHNLANGEGNRDGADWNESSNWGTESPTADTEVLALRAQVARNLLATLVLSLGVPMLGHGDELGRTQQGNNNAWCQDSGLSWMPWTASPFSEAMLNFTRRVLSLRRRYEVVHRAEFLPEPPAPETAAHWLEADGSPMRDAAWKDEHRQALAVVLQTGVRDPDGARSIPGEVFLALNGGGEATTFVLPSGTWRLMLDTERPGAEEDSVAGAVRAGPHTLLLLERVAE